MKYICNIVLLLLLSIGITHAKNLEKVSLQLQWMHQFQFAGYYVAKEKGFYEDVGLDVDILEFQRGNDSVKKVLSQKVNYATGRSSLFVDKSKGKKIVLLVAILQSSPLVFATKKSSGIEKVEDFKGKSIMLTSKKFLAAIDALLMSKRIRREDMKVHKYSFDDKSFIEGKIDILPMYSTDQVYRLHKKGIKLNIFDPKDYGFDFYSDILFTSEKELSEHEKRTENFVRASIKGWKYAFLHIDESVELILKKYNTQHKSKEALIFEAKKLKKLAFFNTDEIGRILSLIHI